MSKVVQIVTSYSLDGEPVIKNRLIPYIKVLTDNGYFVSVVSPDNEEFKLDGISFRHILSPDKTTKPREFIKRFIFEAKQSYRLISLAKTDKEDVRLITIPSMFLLFFAFLFPKNKFHIDLRDITWEYLPEQGLINKLGKLLFRKLAQLNLARASSINVTNDSEFRYLKENLELTVFISKVPNGVGLEQFESLSKLNIEQHDRPVFAYIGNVGIAQELDILIKIAKRVPEVDFYIVGAGTDFYRVEEALKQEELVNLTMTGRLSWEEVLEIYERVNILYAQLSPDFSSAVPSKLYEYLSTGKYIIYGGGAQAESTLSDFEHNKVIPPCNEMALYNALNETLENEIYLKLCESNKQLIAKNFIREHAIENFVKVIGTK